MRTERSREGYLLVDSRGSPGVPGQGVAPSVPEGGVLECPTFTCSHCNGVVVINPDRTRTRARCNACDHLICDTCGIVMAHDGKCRSFARRMDEIQDRALKGLQHG